MFRSASGPSLSINVSSANAPSTQPNATTSSATTSKPLFGTSLSANTQASMPPLFGASAAHNQSQPPQQSTGLFGNLNQPNAQNQPATTNLFGSTSTQQTQPATTNLFGNTLTQQNQPATTNLFGTTATQQNQPATTGLFGNTATQQNQASNTGGLFSSTSGQGAQQTFGSAFGNTNKPFQMGASQTTPQNQNQNHLAASRQPVSIFSNSIGQQSQIQQTVPGVRISVNELRPTTRFNDLHEDLQKAIEFVDGFILNKIQWQEQCEASSGTIEETCQQMPPDVEHLTRNLSTVQRTLEDDANSIAFAKRLVIRDVENAKLSFKAINNLKLPQQFHQSDAWRPARTNQTSRIGLADDGDTAGSSQTLVGCFSEEADEMLKTLEAYKQNVTNVESYLRGIEATAVQQKRHRGTQSGGRNSTGSEDQVRELASVLRDFEIGILGVAARVGEAKEGMQELTLDRK